MLLSLTSIRKAYGERTAVDGLSLSLGAGEVLGLLGPNGAGKSTTISIAVGLLAADAGQVDVCAQGPPTTPGIRRNIGVAPQALALYDDLSADENLRFFASLYGLAGEQQTRAVDGALDRVGLTDRRKDRVKAFSGGMKRRLNLAAALLHDPPIVLLDEPTAGVDPQSRSAILDEVRSLRSRGKGVIYTTHYMEEAQRVCDRVAIIDHGRLIAMGTVDELIGEHGGVSTITVQSGEQVTRFESADPVADLSKRLSDPGVTNVRIDRPDLESVFMHLTGRSLRDS
ncbi:MAG TPA: ABC transporter ATP-binding protein [Phycisphaerales bacterium]|nr:ABC transporter ATP-binding protein [Phycisphaerales bacterium]